MTSFARSSLAVALSLSFAFVASRGLAKDDDPKDKDEKPAAGAGKAEVESFVSDLLASNKQSLKVGSLTVDVAVIGDYLDYLVAKEYLSQDVKESNEKLVKEKLKRVLKSKASARNRAGIRLTFEQKDASATNMLCFEGSLVGNVVKIGTVMGRQQVAVGGQEGDAPQERGLTLFKPQESSLFGGGNVTPSMKVDYSIFQKRAFTIDLVMKNELKPNSKRLEAAVSALIHLSGSGIAGNQVDFHHGAQGVWVDGAKATYDLPLVSPKTPDALKKMLADN